MSEYLPICVSNLLFVVGLVLLYWLAGKWQQPPKQDRMPEQPAREEE
ncbi:MAG: hypothetical protein L0331_05835 [Chloroflexi bacterium]|nr:hypothetical protein [Chloroflexota bacterium]